MVHLEIRGRIIRDFSLPVNVPPNRIRAAASKDHPKSPHSFEIAAVEGIMVYPWDARVLHAGAISVLRGATG
jgi:hypothetical protein